MILALVCTADIERYMSVDLEESEFGHDFFEGTIDMLYYTLRSIVSTLDDLEEFFSFRRGECSFDGLRFDRLGRHIFLQYVIEACRAFCLSLCNELIASLTRFAEDVSWYGENVFALFKSESCRDERSAFWSCFRYNDSV